MSHNANFYRSQQLVMTKKELDEMSRLSDRQNRADVYAITAFFLSVFMIGFGLGALFTWAIL